MKRFTRQLQRARFYMYWRCESDRLTFAASCGQYGFNGETLAASDLFADHAMPKSTDHRAAIALCDSIDSLEAYVTRHPKALDVVFDVFEYWVYEALCERLGHAD